jgi:predicted regulator of Ras-like GTPase activity (Roadblock/LC7/MglB family)
MSSFILTPEKVTKARELIEQNLIEAGVAKVLVIDDAGNILSDCGHSAEVVDTTSLAALTAANFGATSQIAQLIGEDDFSLLFHKGENLSIHFIRVGRELILISIFGESISLGLLRCRIAEIVSPLKDIFEG